MLNGPESFTPDNQVKQNMQNFHVKTHRIIFIYETEAFMI